MELETRAQRRDYFGQRGHPVYCAGSIRRIASRCGSVVAFANLFPHLVQKPWFMDVLHKHADSFDDSAGGVLQLNQ
jgi:hypothetical protein